MRFTRKQYGIGARIGGGWNFLKTEAQTVTGIYVPIEINHFLPIREQWMAELGAGMIYRRLSYNNKTTPIDSSSSALAPYLDVAIRYTPQKKRIFFRLAYTPAWMEKNENQIGTLRASDLQSDWGVSMGVRWGGAFLRNLK